MLLVEVLVKSFRKISLMSISTEHKANASYDDN
jgi:hypothetical protein